ncbi:hypothetical protein [Oceanicoccus sagamiensis]|uniref:Uncharacterized protein n=1 Tax=Oceanicoccus sagamiensis TaxID=716816 RepID=A0A1X9NBV0_9GAMM|nr:hypothetical protein [Oceanicoccus sagamiensis]ARN75518.1 hypothetical protein BST96_16230 [Oceanicoccus sagamiensis]
MKNSLIALLLMVLALMVGLVYSVWQSRQVAIYELEVINRSGVTVQSVRLFGSGVQAEASLKPLMPGRSAIMSVMLKKQGGLQFEVQQGDSRIDTFIEQNINAIHSFHQQLMIEPGQRYLISNYEELTITD